MKVRRVYAPLNPSKALLHVERVCPAWQVVTAALGATRTGPAYFVRRADGSGEWCDGAPPVQVGVYCDEQWRPITFALDSGRALPNLRAPVEVEG